MNHGTPVAEWAFDIAKKNDIGYNFTDEEIEECICCYMNWYSYIQEHMDSLVTEIKKVIPELISRKYDVK